MKALLKFTGSEDPVLSKPFTVMDPQGSVWAIASDRVWFVAVKGWNSCPRYKGGANSLNTILSLLQAEPHETVTFDCEDVLRRIDPEGLASVLGVVVSLRRLSDLLSFPFTSLRAWNATSTLGLSALGFDGPACRAYLMGFDNVVGQIPTFQLVRPSLFDELMGYAGSFGISRMVQHWQRNDVAKTASFSMSKMNKVLTEMRAMKLKVDPAALKEITLRTNDPNPEEESTEMTERSAASTTTVIDVDVVRFGEKIVLPEGLDIKSAIGALTRKQAEEDQDIQISYDFNLTPPEGAIAFLRTLTDMFGFVSPVSTPSFFGPRPPTFLTIETGPDKTESVPWGPMEIPGISGRLQPAINWVNGAPCFRLAGVVKGKHKLAVEKIAIAIRKRTDSLYRGKAIYATFPEPGSTDAIDDYFPKFMRLPNIDEGDLIFSKEIQDLIATALFTPIEYSQVCRDNSISLKRGILLEGPYGTGKTLTATVTARKCVANNWTFIYLRDVKQLPQAINFATPYAPAVIFAEDIDQVLADPDHRDEEVNNILNSIDGIDTKGVEIITVLTTNNVEKITTAMLRPGRLDTVVPVRAPDAEAAIRLVKLFAGDQIADDQDFSEVGASLAGCIPAMIQEVVKRSKLGAVRRAATGGVLEITAHDVQVSTMSMIAHMKLLEPKVPDTRSDRERAAEILGESLGDRISKALTDVVSGVSAKVSNGKTPLIATDTKQPLPALPSTSS